MLYLIHLVEENISSIILWPADPRIFDNGEGDKVAVGRTDIREKENESNEGSSFSMKCCCSGRTFIFNINSLFWRDHIFIIGLQRIVNYDRLQIQQLQAEQCQKKCLLQPEKLPFRMWYLIHRLMKVKSKWTLSDLKFFFSLEVFHQFKDYMLWLCHFMYLIMCR